MSGYIDSKGEFSQDFNELLSKERPRLIRRLKKLYSDANAEEHADDALVKLWEKYGKEPGCFYQRFETLGRVRAWLNKAADNMFKNEARKKGAKIIYAPLDELMEQSTKPPRYMEGPNLLGRIRSLPPESSVLFELFCEGYERKEIAEMMGLPMSTLNGRISRGIGAIRKKVGYEEGIDLEARIQKNKMKKNK